MNAGVIFLTCFFNIIIIFALYFLQKKSLEKTVVHLRQEVQELEDLVAAIIEEFEEVVEDTDLRNNLTTSPVYFEPTKSDFENILDESEQEPESFELENNNEPQIKDEYEQGQLFGFKTDSQVMPEITDPKHRRILSLRDQGLAVEEIAKQLGTGRGEVQLILGIYRRS